MANRPCAGPLRRYEIPSIGTNKGRKRKAEKVDGKVPKRGRR